MRILYLTPTDIDDRSFGGAMRSSDLYKALSRVGEVHTVVLSGSNQFRLDSQWSENWVRHAACSSFGMSIGAWWQRRRIRAWISALLHGRNYDVIVARYLGQAWFVPARAWPRLVLDPDDIFKSPPADASCVGLSRIKLWCRNFIAVRALRRARHVWYVNPQDGPRVGSSRMSWLGNAVDIPDPDRRRAQLVAGRILMVGFFSHAPNSEGLRWFTDAVLPSLRKRHPGIELHAIGRHPPGFEAGFSRDVKIRGFIADLEAEYARAALVIAPVRFGGGTQIKILDALAHGRPLVASTFSHAAFAGQLRDGEHLLVATDAAQWVRHCDMLLAQPGHAEAMGAQGCAAVRLNFGIDHMEATVRATLLDVAGESRRIA